MKLLALSGTLRENPDPALLALLGTLRENPNFALLAWSGTLRENPNSALLAVGIRSRDSQSHSDSGDGLQRRPPAEVLGFASVQLVLASASNLDFKYKNRRALGSSSFWRRSRDSNPRWLSPHPLSKRAH